MLKEVKFVLEYSSLVYSWSLSQKWLFIQTLMFRIQAMHKHSTWGGGGGGRARK